jgi:hypothetical protein
VINLNKTRRLRQLHGRGETTGCHHPLSFSWTWDNVDAAAARRGGEPSRRGSHGDEIVGDGGTRDVYQWWSIVCGEVRCGLAMQDSSCLGGGGRVQVERRERRVKPLQAWMDGVTIRRRGRAWAR